MKNLTYFFLLTFLTAPFIVAAQWTDISPPESNNIQYFDIKFFSNSTGAAVGLDLTSPEKASCIFVTRDAGETWEKHCFDSLNLRSVVFADSAEIVVGGYDAIPGTKTLWIKSSDQGKTWTETSDNTYQGINGVHRVSKSLWFGYGYGTEFGTQAGLVRTEDGGETWDYQYSSHGSIIEDIHFFNKKKGFILSNSFGAEGSIQQSIDGGSSYLEKYAGEWVSDISFPNDKTGYVVEGLNERNLLKTVDGGESWNRMPLNNDVKTVLFINSNVGYTFGENGTIERTEDGGENWESESFDEAETYEVACINGPYIYTCAAAGGIYRSKHNAEIGSSTNPKVTMNTVRAFPNPLNNESKLHFNGLETGKTYELTVYNLIGATVGNFQVSGNASVSLSLPQAGLYQYELRHGNEVFKGSFVKQ